MINENLINLKFNSKEEFEHVLIEIVEPVFSAMQEQNKYGRVQLGSTGAVYESEKGEIEGFLRTLWGLGPLFSNDKAIDKYEKIFTLVNRGIVEGTNTQSKFYWGELHDYDQLFVEMGALSIYLIFTEDVFWKKLSKQEQKNIYNWLNQINHNVIPNTNWLFFRILVNTFFENVNLVKHSDQIDIDLKEIHTYYLDDGWYFDGYKNQIDYYIPFAMQYYGVIFSVLSNRKNSKDIKLFIERSSQFGKTFKEWFTANGAALPFGRSLTYRFAQSSYWAAVLFAGIKQNGVDWSEVKSLYCANMRYWLKQPIFTENGYLSIGYGYPNLIMGEGYNSPGSPYWALKSFIILALPDEHFFWTIDETVPTFNSHSINPYTRMIMVHSEDQNELQAYTVGQHSHEHAHGQAKYEKFVYSTTFGFSVPKGNVLLKQGAFDSTIAVSYKDAFYQTPFEYKKYEIHEEYTYSLWQPFDDVEIESYVVPFYPWHLRLYRIKSNKDFNLISGSFSVLKDGDILEKKNKAVYYQSTKGIVGIESLDNLDCEIELQSPEPNTNVLYNRTVLPLLKYHVPKGKHQVINLFLGDAGNTVMPEKPEVKYNEKSLEITYKEQQTIIDIK